MEEPFRFVMHFSKRRGPSKPWHGTFLRATKVPVCTAQLFVCLRRQTAGCVKAYVNNGSNFVHSLTHSLTTPPRANRKSPDQLSGQSCLDLSLGVLRSLAAVSRQTTSSVTVKGKANERWGKNSVEPCRRFWIRVVGTLWLLLLLG